MIENQKNAHNSFFKIQKETIYFFIVPYLILFYGLMTAVLTTPKAELHLAMNAVRTPWLDWFFKMWTEMGGVLPYVLIALLLFLRFGQGVYLLVAQLIGGFTSLALKHIFAEPRPKLYFELYHPDLTLPVVQGFRLWSTNSFPSGHTITAFAFFFGLALMVKNRWAKFGGLVAAALVGYSRVYLSQHFAVDILVGSLIGVLSAWAAYPLWLKMEKKWHCQTLSQVIKGKKQDNIA